MIPFSAALYLAITALWLTGALIVWQGQNTPFLKKRAAWFVLLSPVWPGVLLWWSVRTFREVLEDVRA